MDFPLLIRAARERLHETQAKFAKRFKTHANTVSRWESGEYEAPYRVLRFVLKETSVKLCQTCQGRGVIERKSGGERL